MWTLGAENWHAGYSTRSRNKYRHVIGNNTKVRSLGEMTTPERYAKLLVCYLAHSLTRPDVCSYVRS